MRQLVAPSTESFRTVIDGIYRTESRRILATLIRLLGDFDLAEEALQDAFTAGLIQWERDGVPSNPRAWLISAGRFKAIDTVRRRAKLDSSLPAIAEQIDNNLRDSELQFDDEIEDDSLRLIFTCCHPALAFDASIALTLREVCGLTTEEIARAYFTSPATMAQRIVRARSKIRDAGIPYEVPSSDALPERVDRVLRVVYLVFNEGYSASSGDTITRVELSTEAIRLGQLLLELIPEPEVMGLLALMLLQESRRVARTSANGELILLDSQDRSLWNQDMIAEGQRLLVCALESQRINSYTVQAAIAAVHSEAQDASATDWAQIAALYGVLNRIDPSPIVELNRAVAVAMLEGPLAGLKIIDSIVERGDLADYYLAHSARAELCRRAGKIDDARVSYNRALALTQQEPERRFLQDRLSKLR